MTQQGEKRQEDEMHHKNEALLDDLFLFLKPFSPL